MKLYPYQQKVYEEAKEILDKHKMVYLALIMRFGKTPIAMELIRHLDKKTLFVTTKSAIQDIAAAQIKMKINTSVDIVNYESLHKIQDKYDVIVLDEAHSKISKFPKPSKSRIELSRLTHVYTQVIWMTGTPQIDPSL